ncbi:hypothetical protein ACG7TL_001683 [Trametes sanguinea]
MSTISHDSTVSPPEDKGPNGDGTQTSSRGAAFWLSYLAIVASVLLSALDLTAVSVALPTITDELHGGDKFTWVGSAYALSSTAILPLSGNFADIFGRKPVMLVSIAIFCVGSAVAGAAQDMNMLIAARTVQGIGGGSILNLTDIILSDLVPLAERGLYQGVLGLIWSFASGVGPPIGGALAEKASWRWLFYMNLPIAGVAFILVFFFLRVKTPEGSMRAKLGRVDWLGNAIIIAGSVLAVLGLTWGGAQYPWSSAKVLAPLIIGLITILAFFIYERKIPAEPAIPWEVVSNRTTIAGYIGTTIHGIVSISIIYYLPVFFQACMGASPLRSAVDALPTSLIIAPFALVCGIVVQVTKRYRLIQYIGWILIIVGFGLMTLLAPHSTVAQWVGYQVVVNVGIGLIYSGTVFPVLAPLPVSRTAAALAFYAFTRSFAQTWGITICSTILQNQLKSRLPSDFTSQFPQGLEIAYAAIPSIAGLPEPLRSQVRQAFSQSMATIWEVMIGIAGIGLLSVPLMREVQMQEETDEKYGLSMQEKVPRPSAV